MNSSPQGGFPGASVPKLNTWRRQTRVLEDVSPLTLRPEPLVALRYE